MNPLNPRIRPDCSLTCLRTLAPVWSMREPLGISSRLVKYILAIAAFVFLNACRAEDPKALVQAGTEKYRAKDFDGAITDYTKAIEADPKFGDAYKFRGLAKSLKGDWKGCLADINSALAISPESLEFLSTRAFTQLHLGDFRAATADFATIERLDPKNGPKAKEQMAQGLISRARSKSASGNNAAAIKDLDMVIALFPELGVAYHERGSAKSDLKQYKEAIADYDLAIKFDAWHNQFGDSYTLRARARRALGDTAGADADDKEAEKRASKLDRKCLTLRSSKQPPRSRRRLQTTASFPSTGSRRARSGCSSHFVRSTMVE